MIQLTKRQHQVCTLIVEGLTNKEIGRRLRLSHRTVEDHRLEVYKKLGAHNGVQLVRRVMAQGAPRASRAGRHARSGEGVHH